MRFYGTWGRVIEGPIGMNWPEAPYLVERELWRLSPLSNSKSIEKWELIHRAKDVGADHSLMVKRFGDDLSFEWRSLKVLLGSHSIESEGPSVEAFLDRVAFPVVESLNTELVTLHGAALAGDCAVVLLGHSGVGKSTTAMALARRGWALRADDVVSIKRNLLRPSASSSRVRGATSETEDFEGSGKARVLIEPQFDTKPISAIFVLKRGDCWSSVRSSNPMEVMPFLFDLSPGIPYVRKLRFQNLANLLRSTPIFVLTIPTAKDGLPPGKQLETIESFLK